MSVDEILEYARAENFETRGVPREVATRWCKRLAEHIAALETRVAELEATSETLVDISEAARNETQVAAVSFLKEQSK